MPIVFFQTVFAWVNTTLSTYALTNAAKVAAAIEPAAVALMVVYIMVWGYTVMTKKAGAEIVMDGALRIVIVGVVALMALRLAMYNELVFDLFFRAPDQLTASIVGGAGTGAVLDKLFSDVNVLAKLFWDSASIFSGDGIGHWIAWACVWLFAGFAIVYTAFLIVISKVLIGVLIAIGPLMIILFLFSSTRSFTTQWLSALAQFAFVSILAILITQLLLVALGKFVSQAVDAGDAVTMATIIPLCAFSVICLLSLRQVPSLSASMASGIALSTYGVVSRTMSQSFGHSTRHGGQFIRGMADAHRGRNDSIPRLLGQGITGRHRRPRQALPAPKFTKATPKS